MQREKETTVLFELNTPVDDERPIYLCSNFKDWNHQGVRYQMSKQRDGSYRLELPVNEMTYPFSYKYHKGDWYQEELDLIGNAPPTRKLRKGLKRVADFVKRWRMNGLSCDPYYLPQKYIIEDDFEIPQLKKRRRIWALLPYDYEHSERSYAVLYLQDAQNLFNESAPFGNWGIDEKLAILSELGYGDIIIVAVEHGERDRIREYSPFDTEEFGSGEGVAYAAFIHDTLKPYIDKKFRTKAHRIHTGIGGSSMGGLISVFTALTYPQTFSKWMIFSPSLWLSSEIFMGVRAHENKYPSFVYLYGGKRESKSMESDLRLFTEILDKKSSNKQRMQYHLSIHPTAVHSESYWGAEFPRAIKWLYYDKPES